MPYKKTQDKLSLLSCILLCCTSMLGSGWLFSTQLVANKAGNYAFIAWILGAVFIMTVALCLCHVVTLYPYRGVNARITAISHNPVFGMPFAFSSWFGIVLVIATEAQASTQYLAPFMGDLIINNGQLTLVGKLLGVGFLCLYLLINWYGVKLLARVNNIITVFKVFTPLFIIAILLSSFIQFDNFTQVDNSAYSIKNIFPAIVASGLIYAFNGFQVITAFASEIKNPKRNITLSIMISIVIILVFYLLLQFSFMGAMPADLLTQGWQGINMSSPIVGLTMALGLHFLTLLLLVDSIVTPSAVGYSFLGSASRMLYGMSEEKQAPRFLSHQLHPKKNISVAALLVNFFIAVIFLLQAENWAQLMITVTMLHIIGYMAAPISMAAISPHTKKFALPVFIAVSLMAHGLPSSDMLLVNILMSILSLSYILITGKRNLKYSLVFATPFIIYLWLLYLDTTLTGHIILSIMFFLGVTDRRYVTLCGQHKQADHP